METPSRFIIIDDDPSSNLLSIYAIRRIYPEMAIQLFENPEVALEFIKTEYSVAAHNVATILLLDINMPILSGWDFLEVYKDFSDHVHEQLSVYILTSSVSVNDQKISTLTPFVTGFFSKPLSSDWIRETFLAKQEVPAKPAGSLLPCYQITKNSSEQYRFKLLDVTGQLLIRSFNTFTNKQDCIKAIEVCRQMIQSEKRYVRLHHGRNFFRLLNDANAIVAVSEMFATSYLRELAIKITKRDGITENLKDDKSIASS